MLNSTRSSYDMALGATEVPQQLKSQVNLFTKRFLSDCLLETCHMWTATFVEHDWDSPGHCLFFTSLSIICVSLVNNKHSDMTGLHLDNIYLCTSLVNNATFVHDRASLGHCLFFYFTATGK